MNERRVTLADIAREAAVHVTTVSLALRNHPRLPESTRLRIQKLAQTFTYLFLTIKGSIQTAPDVGTNFLSAVQSGALKDEASLNNEFKFDADTVRRSMIATARASNLPADETLASVILQGYTLDKQNSMLKLSVRLTSAAGTSWVLYLPIPTVIR